ncbi:MAG: MATE family efflux transporter [Eubacteriales bacterium]|nr:MATE family efflux transporter [Eubacteriales bacterium]
MKENQLFRKEVLMIALPVTMQSLLQSSFGVVDQIMTGQLGSISIAGIGLAAKFTSLYTVVIAAIATGAGIMIAQYIGKEDEKEVGKSFFTNLVLAIMVAILFTGGSTLFPERIMGIYIRDAETIEVAADYLKIYAVSYIPAAFSTLLSTYLRCVGAAALPLYTSVAAALLNTGLNYILIFGKLGCPVMGSNGAALASVIAQFVSCLFLFGLFVRLCRAQSRKLTFALITGGNCWMQYAGILLPILICEFFWGLGENVYALIYGHIGTLAYAAMMLTNPIQALMIGALSGVSQAAGIMIGKSLGAGAYDKAYENSKKLMLYGVAGSLVLSVLLVIFSRYYVLIFHVEASVRRMARRLLLVFALVSPVKVQNMILGGGIIRSGGKTKYIMAIDLIGTWIFGVPLGMLSAFAWKLPIPAVYFILSLEECVRFGISLVVFKRKIWMQRLSD